MAKSAGPAIGASTRSMGAVADRLGAAGILGALPDAVLVIDEADRIGFANPAAEQFFDTSRAQLCSLSLGDLLPLDSAVFTLLREVRASGNSVSEDGVTLEARRIGSHFVTLGAAPLGDGGEAVLLSIHERSIARKIDLQLVHRNAARSIAAMAAILAHEVKNPLSGIRGAAQLLEQNASAADRELARLICDETDRICGLVDRMEVFSDQRPIDRGPVNIHRVLEHVRKVAQTGFARRVRFIEQYDPSLPSVFGNRDQLVQVFLNLVKNAAEAGPEEGAEIVLSTAYQHGVRLTVPGGDRLTHLPLRISVQDNGSGVSEDVRGHLFDAFVTTKNNGTGLGLALVAKIVGDHGGVIEFDSQQRRTVFRVMLPMHSVSGNE